MLSTGQFTTNENEDMKGDAKICYKISFSATLWGHRSNIQGSSMA